MLGPEQHVGDGGHWGLRGFGESSVPELVFCFARGPQGPCGCHLRAQDTVKICFSQILGCF